LNLIKALLVGQVMVGGVGSKNHHKAVAGQTLKQEGVAPVAVSQPPMQEDQNRRVVGVDRPVHGQILLGPWVIQVQNLNRMVAYASPGVGWLLPTLAVVREGLRRQE
jgi:hypothetical protein